jgi:hypothetical protein
MGRAQLGFGKVKGSKRKGCGDGGVSWLQVQSVPKTLDQKQIPNHFSWKRDP